MLGIAGERVVRRARRVTVLIRAGGLAHYVWNVGELVQRTGQFDVDVHAVFLDEAEREERTEVGVVEERRAAEPADDGLVVSPTHVAERRSGRV